MTKFKPDGVKIKSRFFDFSVRLEGVGVRRTSLFAKDQHGLWVAELPALKWDQLDLKQGLIHIKHIKNGVESLHRIKGITWDIRIFSILLGTPNLALRGFRISGRTDFSGKYFSDPNLGISYLLGHRCFFNGFSIASCKGCSST